MWFWNFFWEIELALLIIIFIFFTFYSELYSSAISSLILTIFFTSLVFLNIFNFMNQSITSVDTNLITLIYSFLFLFILLYLWQIHFSKQNKKMEFITLVTFILFLGLLLMKVSDLLEAFVIIESLSFIAYILAGFGKNNKMFASVGIQYLIIGSISSIFLIFSLLIIYYNFSTVNFINLINLSTDFSTIKTNLEHNWTIDNFINLINPPKGNTLDAFFNLDVKSFTFNTISLQYELTSYRIADDIEAITMMFVGITHGVLDYDYIIVHLKDLKEQTAIPLYGFAHELNWRAGEWFAVYTFLDPRLGYDYSFEYIKQHPDCNKSDVFSWDWPVQSKIEWGKQLLENPSALSPDADLKEIALSPNPSKFPMFTFDYPLDREYKKFLGDHIPAVYHYIYDYYGPMGYFWLPSDSPMLQTEDGKKYFAEIANLFLEDSVQPLESSTIADNTSNVIKEVTDKKHLSSALILGFTYKTDSLQNIVPEFDNSLEEALISMHKVSTHNYGYNTPLLLKDPNVVSLDPFYSIENVEKFFSYFEGMYDYFYLTNFSYIPLLINISFLIGALLYKIKGAPFHVWAPTIYTRMPTASFVVLITSFTVIFSVYFFYLFFSIFYSFEIIYTQIFSIIGLLSLIFGFLGAFDQKLLKKFLIYSSIGHVAFLLFTFTGNSLYSNGNFLISYVFIYTLSTIFLWMIISYNSTKVDFLTNLISSIKQNLIIYFSFVIIIFSMSGIPPLAGFYIKFDVLNLLMFNNDLFITFITLLITVASFYYYLRLLKIITFENFSILKITAFKLETPWTFVRLQSLFLGLMILMAFSFVIEQSTYYLLSYLFI